MKIPLTDSVARLGPCGSIAIFVAMLLTAGAVCGWAVSTMSTTSAGAIEDPSDYVK